MRVVTGPVTSSTSAWRGEATMPSPNRWRSWYGPEVRVSSCSQPLQEPASTWRIARLRPRSGVAARRCGGGGGGRGAGSASAVRAGVAELEALVDEREVGQQVVGCGVRDGRPVGVGAGAEADAPEAVAVPFDDAERRAARALDAPDADGRLAASGRCRRGSRPARRGAVRAISSDCSSSSARCSSRARTSPSGRSGTAASKAG